MSKKFKTTHNLPFEATPWVFDLMMPLIKFRVGTCGGLYGCEGKSYVIIALMNDEQGNGHLEDVFEWFENSCRRDKKSLRIVEIMNERFGKHLIEKRGFKRHGKNEVIKHFK